jgi:hypothetical protein
MTCNLTVPKDNEAIKADRSGYITIGVNALCLKRYKNI